MRPSKSCPRCVTKQDLEKLEKRLMAMTKKQLSEALDNATTQIGKIAQEQSDRFDVLTAKVKELTEAIEAGEVGEEITTALAAAQKALDNMDAAIPDAPEPPAE